LGFSFDSGLTAAVIVSVFILALLPIDKAMK